MANKSKKLVFINEKKSTIINKGEDLNQTPN